MSLNFSGCASRGKPAEGAARPPATSVPRPGKAAAPAVAGKSTHPLFIIERSMNANVVHYDAQLTDGGKLDPKSPVIVYWIMLAEDGRRTGLNWLERKKAYGFKIKPDTSGEGYELTLSAAKNRKFLIKKDGDKVYAEGFINGRPAILQKMYIKSRKKLVGQKVEQIELLGMDPKTGEACSEKILP